MNNKSARCVIIRLSFTVFFLIQVCCLGAVGFEWLIVSAALAQFWAVTQINYPHYHWVGPEWAGPELAVRGLTAVFLMVMFLQVNARALPSQNPDVKINNFLVPVLMFGILAHFSAGLVDEYIGPLDKKIRLASVPVIILIDYYVALRPSRTHPTNLVPRVLSLPS